MARTLITGFGPFGAVASNPSERIVVALEELGRRRALGSHLAVRVLPVSYARAAEEIASLIADETFEAVLMFGVATKAAEFRLERYARNRRDLDAIDADGMAPPNTWMRTGSPDTRATSLDLDGLLAHLVDAGMSACVSEDAGSFVCNHTYYAALTTIAERGLSTECQFVHVPADEFAGEGIAAGMPFSEQLSAARAIWAWIG